MSDVVPKDALATLGKVLPEEIDGRDAVHVAVIVAKAAHKIFAGQHLCLSEGIAFTGQETQSIGIADPFLTTPIEEGERFWLFLYPRTITSLKHEWEHPAIPRTDKKAITISEARITKARDEAEDYLRNWCDARDLSYKQMISEIKQSISPNGNVDEWISLSELSSSETIKNPTEFWKYVGLILNKEIKNAPNYFSCFC